MYDATDDTYENRDFLDGFLKNPKKSMEVDRNLQSCL